MIIAALGYSTKVYFNACCKPSPLLDTSKLLSSLPLSLGPGHLSDSIKNVLQLLLDLCVNPEEGLNRLPTAPGTHTHTCISVRYAHIHNCYN